MPSPSLANLKSRLLEIRRRRQGGFTLLELLVAILIGSIITAGLLTLVIEIMTVNNREENLAQTQQSMRRAIDYITRDVSEAVFVYSNLDDLADQLDDAPDGSPVLAFWRLDSLTDDQVDAVNSFCSGRSGDDADECSALLVRQSYYTLVLYVQQDNAGGDIWEGQSRIVRYELPKYETITSSTLNRRDGYADPTLLIPNRTPDTFNSFANWVKADGESTDGISAVLTDFVNVKDDTQTSPCPAVTNVTYARTPAESDSFYTCIAQPDGAVNDPSSNKSLVVYLQGNASRRDPDDVVGMSEASSLPKLESEVLIRGVIQDDPTAQ